MNNSHNSSSSFASSPGAFSVNQEFLLHHFDNGVTLLGEVLPQMASAAVSILLPFGAVNDAENTLGSANLLLEMFNKGAGPWNAQEVSQKFEDLGIHKSQAAGIELSNFSAAMLGENAAECLRLLGRVLLEPSLPQEELENVKALAAQDLLALEEDLASKVMSELAAKFYPQPFGRNHLGTLVGIEATSIDSLREMYRQALRRSELMIGIAGRFDWQEIIGVVGESFSAWNGQRSLSPVGALPAKSSAHHLARETSQVQIALAYPSVSYDDPNYYAAKVAVGVLSGGMSGRLFIEVREKRGLVYRVSASHSAARGRAAIFASAGTTPDNAEETLAVILEQLRGIGQEIGAEELQRAKADLKSKIIMRGESTAVRASTLANDWWNLGRVRTLAELRQGIEAVQPQNIVEYCGKHPVSPVTLVTLGPKALAI